MKTIDQAKAIAKAHGIKGFRKLALKRPRYYVGKQTVFIDPLTALSFIDALKEAGYFIQQEVVVRDSLKNHERFDTLTIDLAASK